MTSEIEPHIPGVRERTRAAIREELAQAAIELFSANGFQATTARQIAEAVGVSERTFFRYFPSKEDVILGELDGLGRKLAARLAARPSTEPPFEALRRSFDLMTETLAKDPRWSTALLRLTRDVPALRARQIEKQDRWRELLSIELQARAGGSASGNLLAHLQAAAALSVLDAAVTYWDSNGGELSDILDQAFALVLS